MVALLLLPLLLLLLLLLFLLEYAPPVEAPLKEEIRLIERAKALLLPLLLPLLLLLLLLLRKRVLWLISSCCLLEPWRGGNDVSFCLDEASRDGGREGGRRFLLRGWRLVLLAPACGCGGGSRDGIISKG